MSVGEAPDVSMRSPDDVQENAGLPGVLVSLRVHP